MLVSLPARLGRLGLGLPDLPAPPGPPEILVPRALLQRFRGLRADLGLKGPPDPPDPREVKAILAPPGRLLQARQAPRAQLAHLLRLLARQARQVPPLPAPRARQALVAPLDRLVCRLPARLARQARLELPSLALPARLERLRQLPDLRGLRGPPEMLDRLGRPLPDPRDQPGLPDPKEVQERRLERRAMFSIRLLVAALLAQLASIRTVLISLR